jgi:hypothetical protein
LNETNRVTYVYLRTHVSRHANMPIWHMPRNTKTSAPTAPLKKLPAVLTCLSKPGTDTAEIRNYVTAERGTLGLRDVHLFDVVLQLCKHICEEGC